MADPKIRIRATDETGPAFRTANANMDGLSSSAGALSTRLLAIAPALLGLAAASKLAGMAKAINDNIDAFNDLRDATGSTIEKLSALDDIAARTGTSFDTVGTALITFNRALKDAKPGSDADAAFSALGLSLAELKRQDPSEALRSASVALAGFADDGNRARLVQELFGKSVREVAPFLKNLADNGTLVAKVTTTQAEEAEKFNRELLVMNKNLQDIGRGVVSAVVPAFNSLIEKIRTARREQTGWFASMESLAAQAKARSDALYTGSWSDAGGGRGFVNPPLVRPSVGDVTRAGSKPASSGRAAGSSRDAINEAQLALSRYVDQLQGAIDRTQDLTEVEKARNFLLGLGTTGQVQQVRDLVLSMATQIDAEKALTDAQQERMRTGRELAIEQGRAIEEANAAYQAMTDRLLAPTATTKLAESRADMLHLVELFEKGRIGETQYLEAVTARLDLASAGYEKMTTFAEQAAKNIQDSIGNGLADILQGNFSNIEKSFTTMINRMVAEAAAAKITEGLFGKGGSGGGLFGDVLGSFGKLLSFDGGGYTGNRPRTGGVDGRGGFLAVMHGNETVTDHASGQRAGANVSVVVNQSFGGNTSRATVLQAAADARRQLELATRNL